MDFNPTERIHELLGPSPTNPWASLIPQILLWCFRRFCIEKLLTFEGQLYEFLWEDHLELIQRYCPKGLEHAAIDWMTPDNIIFVHSSLEDYNKFFIDFIIRLDTVIMSEDYASQDELSEFLDVRICSIISDWVTIKPLLVFPTEPTEDDEFSEAKFEQVINTLIQYSNTEVVIPEPPVETSDSQSLLWKYLSYPLIQPEPLPEPPPEPLPQPPPEPLYQEPPLDVVPEYFQQVPPEPQQEPPEPQQEPPEPQQEPPPETLQYQIPVEKPPRLLFDRNIASGIAYRRTLRKNHKIYLPHYGKTRKSHPAL